MFAEYVDKFVKGKERNKLKILGDKSTLIQQEWYREVKWKFGKAKDLVDDLVEKEFAELQYENEVNIEAIVWKWKNRMELKFCLSQYGLVANF